MLLRMLPPFWWIIILRAYLMVDQTDEGNFVEQCPPGRARRNTCKCRSYRNFQTALDPSRTGLPSPPIQFKSTYVLLWLVYSHSHAAALAVATIRPGEPKTTLVLIRTGVSLDRSLSRRTPRSAFGPPAPLPRIISPTSYLRRRP